MCTGNRNRMRNVRDIQHLRGCVLFETLGTVSKLLIVFSVGFQIIVADPWQFWVRRSIHL